MSSPARSGLSKKQPQSESRERPRVSPWLVPWGPVGRDVVKYAWENRKEYVPSRLYWLIVERSWLMEPNRRDADLSPSRAAKLLKVDLSQISRATAQLKEDGRLEEVDGFRPALNPKPREPLFHAPGSEAVLKVKIDREVTRAANRFGSASGLQELSRRYQKAPTAEISVAKEKLEIVSRGAKAGRDEISRLAETEYAGSAASPESTTSRAPTEVPKTSGEQRAKVDRFVKSAKNELSPIATDAGSNFGGKIIGENEANAFEESGKGRVAEIAAAATKIFGARFNKKCDYAMAEKIDQALGNNDPNRFFIWLSINKANTLYGYGLLPDLASQFIDDPAGIEPLRTEPAAETRQRIEDERSAENIRRRLSDG